MYPPSITSTTLNSIYLSHICTHIITHKHTLTKYQHDPHHVTYTPIHHKHTNHQHTSTTTHHHTHVPIYSHKYPQHIHTPTRTYNHIYMHATTPNSCIWLHVVVASCGLVVILLMVVVFVGVYVWLYGVVCHCMCL